MFRQLIRRYSASCCFLLAAQCAAAAPPQPIGNQQRADGARPKANAGERQTELEAALAQMLSGATLEGTYTSTGPGSDPTKLSQDKYTLGDVRKLGGRLWLIPARIQYGEHDVTLPITVPIDWAGDTPVIVVDNLGLPPFGAVSARVMFFDGHYAGYWKHGEHGGHLFGVIKPGEKNPAPRPAAEKQPPPSLDSPADEQVDQ
jgi:hypothetical protein